MDWSGIGFGMEWIGIEMEWNEWTLDFLVSRTSKYRLKVSVGLVARWSCAPREDAATLEQQNNFSTDAKHLLDVLGGPFSEAEFSTMFIFLLQCIWQRCPHFWV